MQPFLAILCTSALLLTGCRHSALESKLVGEWLSGCSIDICTITTLNADHTFEEKFDEKDLPGNIYSGTWHLEGDQLVMRVTWADKSSQDMIGKDLHLIISDLQGETFVATLAEDRMKTSSWKRLRITT